MPTASARNVSPPLRIMRRLPPCETCVRTQSTEKPANKKRCRWAASKTTDALMAEYHDREWGVPVHDDRLLFEFLILEGAQAGLSWITILKKRPAYRKTFDRFCPRKVAKYDEAKVERLLLNAGIVRDRV